MNRVLVLHLGIGAVWALISVQSQGSPINCNRVLTELSSVSINQMEATDLRRLHVAAKAKVFRSLTDSWVEVNTSETNPTFGGKYQKITPHLIQVNEVREDIRGGHRVAYIYGTNAQFDSGDLKSSLHVEIPFDDIVSIRLIEKPQIIISLLPVYKPDGRPHLGLNHSIEEKIITMAEGDTDALFVLGKLMSAKTPEVNGIPVSFESLLKTLDSENIRGAQLVAAYRHYAWGNIDKLVTGIFQDPTGLARAVNTAMGSEYKYRAKVPGFIFR